MSLPKIGIINLGCARNLVDSQTILGQMKKSGFAVDDVEKSDMVVVNTCAFIEEAKKESIDAILDLIELIEQQQIIFKDLALMPLLVMYLKLQFHLLLI